MNKDKLMNLGYFTSLEANYLLLGHTLAQETEHFHRTYRFDVSFEGSTLVIGSKEKGVKNALWEYTEHTI